MSDRVENPKDMFFHDAAHMFSACILTIRADQTAQIYLRLRITNRLIRSCDLKSIHSSYKQKEFPTE